MNTASAWVKNKRSGYKSKSLSKWKTMFLKATDHDRWQEKLVAVPLYENLQKDMEVFCEDGRSDDNDVTVADLTPVQKSTVQKVSQCIQCRINNIQHNESTWMTLTEIMKLKEVMKDILSWRGVFPILIQETQTRRSVVSLLSSTDSGLGDYCSDYESDHDENELLPRLPKIKGLTRMSLQIEKIGLKDTNLVEPYLAVSVRDSVSVNLTPMQSTGTPKNVQDFHLHFDAHIEVQKYIEKIPKGSNIFFELRHKKLGKTKTKCFAVLKRNEFQSNKGYLELYKGPANYHLKNLENFTQKKPLFLHVDIKLLD